MAFIPLLHLLERVLIHIQLGQRTLVELGKILLTSPAPLTRGEDQARRCLEASATFHQQREQKHTEKQCPEYIHRDGPFVAFRDTPFLQCHRGVLHDRIDPLELFGRFLGECLDGFEARQVDFPDLQDACFPGFAFDLRFGVFACLAVADGDDDFGSAKVDEMLDRLEAEAHVGSGDDVSAS